MSSWLTQSGKDLVGSVRLYVGNMPFSATEDELRTLFEAQGQVVSVAVITDRESGRSRGFGFVEMADEAAGRKAIDALDKSMLDGRALVVNEARPRTGGGGRSHRGGGGGGWGGGGGGGGGRARGDRGGGGGGSRDRDRGDRW